MIPSNFVPRSGLIHSSKEVQVRFKPYYELDITNDADRESLRQLRTTLESMAEPLRRDVVFYHWSETAANAEQIAKVGTGPGLAQGLGTGKCGRGFYVQLTENDAPPLPTGRASSSENPALLRIAQTAHDVKVLNCNNKNVQEWFLHSGLSGPDPHGASDIEETFFKIDEAFAAENDPLPLIVVMPNNRQPCEGHDPLPDDACVIKFPVTDGQWGCSISVVENPPLPQESDTSESSSDDDNDSPLSGKSGASYSSESDEEGRTDSARSGKTSSSKSGEDDSHPQTGSAGSSSGSEDAGYY